MYNKYKFPKIYSVILMFLGVLLFIPNITMFRIVQIGGFQESLAIFFFPFVYSIAGSITEVHGKENALFVLISCYIISLFFSIALMLSCYLPFPDGSENIDAYKTLFMKGPYIILVGMFSVGISMFVNIKLMDKLRISWRNQHFIVRSLLSASIGEFIVTILAYPLIFLTINQNLIYLMINAYLFKVAYSCFGAIPAKFLVYLMRRIDLDNLDTYNIEYQKFSTPKNTQDCL